MDKKTICEKIGYALSKALLYEVTCAVKPGLVDRFDSGAHDDMDIFTFIDSVCAIGRYFEKFALIGYGWEEVSPGCLQTIRPLGIECEKEMFSATNGINTHKGAIFSMSVIAACSAYCFKKNGRIDTEKVCSYSAITVSDVIKDFENLDKKEKLSHGEKLYLKYGCKGIRGEVMSGFQSVREFSLSEIRKLDSPHTKKEEVLVTTLLKLVANVEDTNILSRSDHTFMALIQEKAKLCISMGGAYTEEGKKKIDDLDNLCKLMKISPGGCADLLAVTIAFYFLERI